MTHRSAPASARAREGVGRPAGQLCRLLEEVQRGIEVAEPVQDVRQVEGHVRSQVGPVETLGADLARVAKERGGAFLLTGGHELRGDLAGGVDRLHDHPGPRGGAQPVPGGRRPPLERAHAVPRRREPVVRIARVAEPLGGLGEQRMLEAHAVGRDLVEDAVAHGWVETLGGNRHRGAGGPGEHCERRARARDRRGAQQRTSVVVEPFERAFEDVTDHAAAIGGAYELPHKERIATGPSLQRDGVDGVGRLGGGEPAHPFDVEPSERHETRYPSHAIDAGHVGFVISAGHHERDRHVGERPWQVLEHPDRDRIGPLEVFEDHQGGAHEVNASESDSSCSHRRSSAGSDRSLTRSTPSER